MRDLFAPSRRSRVRTEFVAFAALALAFGCASRRTPEVARPSVVPLIYDEHGGLLVEASIDGREPVRLILDTGASRSALARSYAERLGLKLRAGGSVEGSAGVVEARSATATVEVAGTPPLSIDWTIYEFASYDARCVGVLGREWLERAQARALVRHRPTARRLFRGRRRRRIPRQFGAREARSLLRLLGGRVRGDALSDRRA